jgi:transposase-like protein
MARTPDPTRHAIWRDRVRRQETSGLTITQFCTQEGLTRSKFYAWKRRLRLTGPPEKCPAIPTPSTFLPVTIRPAERTDDEQPPIEAELPNGVRLRIPTGNAHLACRLVRAVAGAKTHPGGSR